MKLNELICAFGTAAGTAALAVLRISGEGAAQAADKMFRFGPLPKLTAELQVVGDGEEASVAEYEPAQTVNPEHKVRRTVVAMKGYQAAYGHIVDPLDQETVDEVVLLRYKAPHSFTGEEMIEISCHGGIVSKERLLQAAINAGCRLATAGEFSKRAFLNGKFSLVEAEGLADLLSAEAKEAQTLALAQLAGSLGAVFKSLEEKLLLFEARVQMAIEFPEYPEYDIDYDFYRTTLDDVKAVLGDLQAGYQRGKVAKEGLKVALLGAPNAGKSSLLNAFYGDDRAIVTNIPGTTRDVLEVDISYKGLLLRLADTAGVRESDDIVEREGIKRSFKTAFEADMVLWLVGDKQFDADAGSFALPDEDFLKKLAAENIYVILLAAKQDLPEHSLIKDKLLAKYDGTYPVHGISVYDSKSIENILQLIYSYYERLDSGALSATMVSSLRQYEAIGRMREILDALDAVAADDGTCYIPPLDIMDQMLQAALEEVQLLLGEQADEALLNTIFNSFCVGK